MTSVVFQVSFNRVPIGPRVQQHQTRGPMGTRLNEIVLSLWKYLDSGNQTERILNSTVPEFTALRLAAAAIFAGR